MNLTNKLMYDIIYSTFWRREESIMLKQITTNLLTITKSINYIGCFNID